MPEPIPGLPGPTDYRAAYHKLRDALQLCCYSHRVDKYLLIKDRREQQNIKEHILRMAAKLIGMKLLEEGFIKFEELPELPEEEAFMRPGGMEMRCTIWALPPGQGKDFEARLDERYLAGYLAAVNEIKNEAAKLSNLGDYGPVQALAMNSVANSMYLNATKAREKENG